MTRLTKLQTALMEQANAGGDGTLLPVPETFSTTGAALERAAHGLVRKGYVTQGASTSDDAGDGKVLRLTAAGREAVAPVPTAAVPPEEETPEAKAARPGGKLGAVLKTVGRKRGATLDELTELTGWQPHTTRAALTRLRQRGFRTTLADEGGRRVYRLQG